LAHVLNVCVGFLNKIKQRLPFAFCSVSIIAFSTIPNCMCECENVDRALTPTTGPAPLKNRVQTQAVFATTPPTNYRAFGHQAPTRLPPRC
jgi:hypothetical protein